MTALDHILHDSIELGEMVRRDGRETRLGSGGCVGGAFSDCDGVAISSPFCLAASLQQAANHPSLPSGINHKNINLLVVFFKLQKY